MKRFLTPECILVFYLHVFYYLKIVYAYIPIPSMIVLGAVTFGLVLLGGVLRPQFEMATLFRLLLVLSGLVCLFFLNLLFAPNEFISQYALNALIYAIYPLILLSLVQDFQMLIKGHIFFSVLTGIILMTDVVTHYKLTGGYMPFGFGLYMYSMTGLALGYTLKHKKWYLFLFLIEWGLIGIWGNKGAFIAGGVLFFIITYSRLATWGRIVFIVVNSIVLIFYKKILVAVLEFIFRLRLSTYGLNTMYILLSNSGNNADKITSLRTDIWEKALYLGWEKYLGVGIGGFEKLYPNWHYPHNVFLDILVTFGILGLIIFTLVLIWSLIKIVHTKNKPLKVCRLGALLGWFLPMQFSLSFWNVLYFWFYFGLVFIVKENSKES